MSLLVVTAYRQKSGRCVMPDRSTPSFSEFVRRHRAAADPDVHDEAEKTAASTFDWVGATAAGIAESSVGVFHHHRDDARTVVPPRRAAKAKQAAVQDATDDADADAIVVEAIVKEASEDRQ
jgi:hypothetical protein